MAAITVENLRKEFRVVQKEPGIRGALKALVQPHWTQKLAVDGLDFQIEQGEIVGYIGVNGAGKSTTIKMLTGVLAPSSGRIEVLGRDPFVQRRANAQEIGVVFGQRTQLWWDLALIESLNLVARIYQVPPQRYRQLLEQFSHTLELDELLNKPIRSMSLGQKMRAELAATLIHEPRVVYLDEPTIGLDVVVKERIRAFIRETNRSQGTTVLLTTHDLGDIEELCQRVIIIDSGRVIYDGPLATIKERFGIYRSLILETDRPVTSLLLPAGAQQVATGDPLQVEVRFDRNQLTATQVVTQVMPQVEVQDFSLREPSLTSVIKQIYAGALEQTATS